MADIETALQSLNPMDFVTGMRKGFELGTSRAEETRATALGDVAKLTAEEFGSVPNVERRAAETQLGKSTAQLGDVLNQINIEATGQARPDILKSLVQQAENIRMGTQTRGIELQGGLTRAPMQQGMLTAQTMLQAENFPEVQRRQQAAFDFQGKVDAWNQGDQEAGRVVVETQRGVQQTLNNLLAQPENKNLDPYDLAEKAILATTDPNQKALLALQQRAAAVEGLKREGTTFAGAAKWLPRAIPGAEVRLTPGTTDQVDIIQTQFEEVYDSQTRTTQRVPSRRVVQSGVSLREDQPNNIRRYITQATGGTVPFITPNLKQTGAAAVSPAAAGAAAAGGAAKPVNAGTAPPPTPSSVVQPPSGQAPAAPAARGAAVGPPTPLAAQGTELDTMLTQIQNVPPANRAQAAQLSQLEQAIVQLKKRQQVVSPQVMDQLRKLVAANPAQPTSFNPLAGIGQAIGQALPVPEPVPAEQTIQQLLQPAR